MHGRRADRRSLGRVVALERHRAAQHHRAQEAADADQQHADAEEQLALHAIHDAVEELGHAQQQAEAEPEQAKAERTFQLVGSGHEILKK